MLRQPHRLIAAAIIAFWVVMVALFFYREGWFGRPGDAPRAAVDAPSRSQDQWMGIFLEGGQRVGHIHWTTESAERAGVPGVKLNVDAAVETSLFGFDAGMDIGGTAWTAEDGSQGDFDFSLTSSGHAMSLDGTLAAGRLKATLNTGGQEIPFDLPVEAGLLSGGGLGLSSAGLPDLDPGESAEIDAFDPVAMRMGKATIQCVGEEQIEIEGVPTEATLFTTTTSGMTSKAWIGEDGEILQASTPFGFVLKKIAPESVDDGPGATRGDLIASLAIFPTGVAVPTDPRRLTLRFSGLEPDRIPENPPWQRWTEAGLEMVQPESFPISAGPLTSGAEMSPYLASDAFVTADHPEIVAQARAIVGDGTDRAVQARRIYDWVFENIEKVPVLSVPSALDVLRERTGDCNEHTVLFAALARAAGVPCRIAIGLVYSDQLEGFGYHAWPEVYVDGWIPMDPTLGQVTADASHVKLLEGSIEKWVQLAAFIGQVEIEVLAGE